MAINDTWTTTITLAPGVVVTVIALQTVDGVQFTLDVTEGFADLRGFFFNERAAGPIGYQHDSWGDSQITDSGKFATTSTAVLNQEDSYVGSKDNNMNGTGEKFDGGITFGSEGAGKDDISSVTFTLTGLTMEDLTSLSFGIRATSVGTSADSREGSAKELGIFPPPKVIDPVPDHFPEFEKDISHVILVFDTDSGDKNDDGYYTVKIDEWDGSNDLDDELGDILAYLIANDPNVSEDTVLLGAQIKGGNVGTANGAYDDYWAADGSPDTGVAYYSVTNGNNTKNLSEITSPDVVPTGLDLSQGSQTNVDMTYDYSIF